MTHKSVCDGGEVHGGGGGIVHEEHLVQLAPFAVRVAVILKRTEK